MLFKNGQFVFDAGAGKIRFELTNVDLLSDFDFSEISVNLDTTTTDIVLYDVQMTIRPARTLSFKRQFELARMFGFNDEYVTFNSLTPVEFVAPLFFWNLVISQPELQIFRDTVADPNFADLYPVTLLTYYAPLPSDITRYPIIHINSSANSNMHNPDGSKLNTIAILHFVNSQTEISKDSVLIDSRIYEIRDSTDGLRNITLTVEDPSGEPIFFQSEFTLELAVWFKSENAM